MSKPPQSAGPRFEFRLYRVLTSLLLSVALSGCQSAYPCQLRGVIRSEKDGKPLAGVELNISLTSDILDSSTVFPLMTGPDGFFHVDLRVSDRAFHPHRQASWSLTLSKKGFREMVVDLGQFKEPQGSGTTTIVVAAFLREND